MDIEELRETINKGIDCGKVQQINSHENETEVRIRKSPNCSKTELATQVNELNLGAYNKGWRTEQYLSGEKQIYVITLQQ